MFNKLMHYWSSMAKSACFSMCAFVAGFVSYTVVCAANSTVTPSNVTRSTPNPVSYSWTNAKGSLVGTSGQVWVNGEGTLTSMGTSGGDENNWVTTWYGQDMTCTIACEEPFAKWVVDASCSMYCKSYAAGRNDAGFSDDCRAETTGTVEIKGDFNGFDETQVAVDNYTGATNGFVDYDAVGGGPSPTTYPNGGAYRVMDAYRWNNWSVGVWITGQEKAGKTATFFVYARGKQYMHAKASIMSTDTRSLLKNGVAGS